MAVPVNKVQWGVPRWEPDSLSRLQEAALELFRERGYDDTTVVEISRRAGLTERTFFRYFADKREVLFAGAKALQDFLVSAVFNAPEGLVPIDLVATSLESLGDFFSKDRREYAQLRQAIIVANPELQERELIKLATLAGAIANTLRERKVKEPVATLTAELEVVVFKTAFERWVEESNRKHFAQLVRMTIADISTLTAGD